MSDDFFAIEDQLVVEPEAESTSVVSEVPSGPARWEGMQEAEGELRRFNVGAMLFGPTHAAAYGLWRWFLIMIVLDFAYGLIATYTFYALTSTETVWSFGFFLFIPTQPALPTLLMLPILIWRAVYAKQATVLAWRELARRRDGWRHKWLAWKAFYAPTAALSAKRFAKAQAVWTALAIGIALGPYLSATGFRYGYFYGPGHITAPPQF